ncbi:MAG: argininosuccinate lyase, partial [Acidimicrobiia bacterium]
FREAHAAVGRLVLALERAGRTLSDAGIEDLAAVNAAFTPEDLDVLDVTRSVRSRASAGGGSPESVLDQVTRIRELASGDRP